MGRRKTKRGSTTRAVLRLLEIYTRSNPLLWNVPRFLGICHSKQQCCDFAWRHFDVPFFCCLRFLVSGRCVCCLPCLHMPIMGSRQSSCVRALFAYLCSASAVPDAGVQRLRVPHLPRNPSSRMMSLRSSWRIKGASLTFAGWQRSVPWCSSPQQSATTMPSTRVGTGSNSSKEVSQKK